MHSFESLINDRCLHVTQIWYQRLRPSVTRLILKLAFLGRPVLGKTPSLRWHDLKQNCMGTLFSFNSVFEDKQTYPSQYMNLDMNSFL